MTGDHHLTTDQLIAFARARLELDALIKLGDLNQVATLIPLYFVQPDRKPNQEQAPDPFVVAIAWQAEGPSRGVARFVTVKDREAQAAGELPDLDDPHPIPLPWWSDPAGKQYQLNRTRRKDGADAVYVSRQLTTQIAFLEAIAVAVQLNLTISFVYAKPGHADEVRKVVARWVGGRNGNLLGGDDLNRPTDDPDRPGAPRTFRVDRIRGLELLADELPRWDDGAWVRARGGE